MLKHWPEAQIQHNRNYESCLVIPALYYKPNMHILPIPKWDLPPKICQLPDGCVKWAKSPPDIRCNPNFFLVNEAKL